MMIYYLFKKKLQLTAQLLSASTHQLTLTNTSIYTHFHSFTCHTQVLSEPKRTSQQAARQLNKCNFVIFYIKISADQPMIKEMVTIYLEWCS